jgi:isopentenyldiphosphate isomerase
MDGRPNPLQEMVDVIDADGRTVSVATRSAMRRHRLRHRAVFVAVRSSDGKVLVHQRSERKDLWPSRWDLAVGGVVASGEDWVDAAVREVAEEIGVAVSSGAIEPLGTGWYADSDVDLHGWVGQIVHDGPFTFSDGEVVSAHFVDRAELDALVDSRPVVPDSLQLVLPRLAFPSCERRPPSDPPSAVV